jgi:Cu-Zn family superoxide dismutase
VLTKSDGTSLGVITFRQPDEDSPVKVEGKLEGLEPGDHGLHIHADAIPDGGSCDDAGPHFNPYEVEHGGKNGQPRHVGDFGNVNADDAGQVEVSLEFPASQVNKKNYIESFSFRKGFL